MMRLLLVLLIGLSIAGCRRPDRAAPASRAAIVRSFADEIQAKTTVSIGRYRHALASVQGMPVEGAVTYTFAVTIPVHATLRFRPLMHPAATACWQSPPQFRVVLNQQQTDVVLWAGKPAVPSSRLWMQALLSRIAPQFSTRNLLPREVALPLTATGRATLRFEANGKRNDCDLSGWHAKNGGHTISPAAIWGMPILQAPDYATRPDVIVIVIDTLRADVLSQYGGPVTAPNFHRFAQDSIRFERAFTTFPMTRESTFSLMTGLHPAQLGVPYWRWPLRPEERTIAAARAAESLPVQARKNGMRSVFAGNNGFLTDTVPLAYDGNWGDVRFFYKEPYDAEQTIKTFASWADDPQQLFAYLHFNQPHWPHVIDPAHPAKAAGGFSAEYVSEVLSADEALGRIFAALRKNKRFDNSLIIVTADHGELFPHGEKAGHGTTLEMGELHVPLFIRMPHGRFGARSIKDTVTLADIAPTIREALGWEPKPSYGRSLMPLIRGDYAALPPRLIGWEGKGIDGYTDGKRFYTAYHAGYSPMEGMEPGALERAWQWASDQASLAVTEPTPADRLALGQVEDEWLAMRQHAWAQIAGAKGPPPLPPRPLYAFDGVSPQVISTQPPGALRPATASSGVQLYHLIPPSATIRISAQAPVAIGRWGLPFGGASPAIYSGTERQLMFGKPSTSNTGPAAWIEAGSEDSAQMAAGVKDALRGWGYVQ